MYELLWLVGGMILMRVIETLMISIKPRDPSIIEMMDPELWDEFQKDKARAQAVWKARQQ